MAPVLHNSQQASAQPPSMRKGQGIKVLLFTVVGAIAAAALIFLCIRLFAHRPETEGFEGEIPLESSAVVQTPIPKSRDMIFREGVKEVILNTVRQSDRLSSLSLDSLLQNTKETELSRSNETNISFLLSTAEDTVVITQQLLFDAAEGSAVSASQLQSGEEIAGTASMNFINDCFYIQRADASEPLIRYTLSPEDAASLAKCSAYERAIRIFSGAQHKPDPAEWEDAVDAYLSDIEQLTPEETVQETKEELVYAGEAYQGSRYVLELSGRDAFTAYREYIDLTRNDPLFTGLFNNIALNENSEYLQSGFELHVQELNSLTEAEIDAFTLTFEYEQTDVPVGIRVFASTGEKTASMRMLYFENGEQRETELYFYGFDGAGSALTESRSKTQAGDAYEGFLNYTLTDNEAQTREQISVHTVETLTANGRTGNLTCDMSLSDLPDMDAFNLTANLDYAEERGEDVTALLAEGSLSLQMGDEETDEIHVNASIDQRFGDVSITSPVFIEGSGINAPDLQSLFNELEMDTTPEGFQNAPVSVRGLTVALLSLM
jgi:hypothetical protein